MIIDLRQCDTRYINLDAAVDRNKMFLNVIKQLDLKTPLRIPGILSKHKNFYFAELSEAYFNALSSITKGVPTIIFEDDAVPLDNYNNLINIPDDADAVYLGASTYGYNGLTPENRMQQEGKNILLQPKRVPGYPNVYKINNALATHSVLYITNRAVDLAKQIAQKSFTTQPSHIDFALTEMQDTLNVYIVGPLFYQYSYEQEKNWATDVTLNVKLDRLAELAINQ